MNRDRLHVVLRLREMREQEALVARAEACRNAAEAAARTSVAALALAGGVVEAGTRSNALGLQAARLQGLALGDELAMASDVQASADRAAARAEDVRVQTAIARRSVERLQERRSAQLAAATAKTEARRDDDIALQVWRRTR
jgi:hypothetical protein